MPADIQISEREYQLLSGLIYERTGISLGGQKRDLVKARLAKRLKSLKCATYREYYEHLLSGDGEGEFTELFNSITTNVTSFFRESKHFDFLHRTALPALLQRNRLARRLRVWSAASATGEEVYTLAMCLLEFRGLQDWDVRILGTDLSTKVLQTAIRGRYGAERVQTVPRLILDRYFNTVPSPEGTLYEVKPACRELVVFRQFNLLQEHYPFRRPFDVIFCRNVMIYFDKPTQIQVVRMLCRCLAPGGYLFIGHSESLIGHDSGLQCLGPSIFQKAAAA